jgi:16S rRNA (guanine527-N7)-methyltransferase
VIENHLTQPMQAAREVYGERFPLLNRYVDILGSTAVAWGLLGPREADRLWDRHILNSAALGDLIAPDSAVVDVGSGAGLPGIPLAILRPDLRVTLIEPLLRRLTFLTQTVEELGISDRVEVVRSRAEDHQRTYDVVVARALAPLDRLIGWCNPLRAPGGVILALKGSSAADEVAAARRQLDGAGLRAEVLKARPHPDVEPATVVRLRAAPEHMSGGHRLGGRSKPKMPET